MEKKEIHLYRPEELEAIVGLTKEEKETTVSWSYDLPMATVWTSDNTMLTKMKKLKQITFSMLVIPPPIGPAAENIVDGVISPITRQRMNPARSQMISVEIRFQPLSMRTIMMTGMIRSTSDFAYDASTSSVTVPPSVVLNPMMTKRIADTTPPMSE